MADVEIRVKAKNEASGVLDEVEGDLDDLNKSAENAGKSSGTFGDKWATAMLGVNQTLEILEKAYQAFKKIYETAREGAALEFTATKFDNLAVSIGTTSDVLLNDLREATSGMMSDAELMQSATDMMGLGLAGTRDEAIRLASVAGQLGMNMNQLVLTLTNKTTMRFDALGVSVAGFEERVKDLEAAGMSADEAFQEAFLQQAEEQIDRVGSAADTTMGDFMRLEAATKNLSNRLKMDLAESLEGVVSGLADSVSAGVDFHNELEYAVERGAITQEEYAEVLGKVRNGIMDQAEATEWASEETVTFDDAIRNAVNGTNLYDDSLEMAKAHADGLAESQTALEEATMSADDAMRSYNESLLFKIASEGLSSEAALDLAYQMGLVDERTVYATEQIDIWRQMLDDGKLTLDQYNERVALLNTRMGEIKDASAKITITWDERGGPSGLAANVLRGGGGRHKRIELNEAAGGIVHAVSGVSASAPYWVGELGPEPFFPSQDGRIVSNSEAKAAMRGGGSKAQSINVVINTPMNFADRVWVENELAPYIRDAMARAQL